MKESINVESVISKKTTLPYIILFHGDKQIAQLTLPAARNIANDILIACSRIEADAVILRFFSSHEFPEGASNAILLDFRNFRFEIDSEVVEKLQSTPACDMFDFTKKKPQ